jgi:nondiscriminating aspartyl-tRNA synthetase
MQIQRTYVCDAASNTDPEILVKGWVHKIHDLGKITFVHLRDKTGIIQLVFAEGKPDHLRLEMSIEARGKKVENPKAPGGLEIAVEKMDILGKAYYDKLPFEINSGKMKASLETQLDHRTITLRMPKVRAIFRVQEVITDAFRTYLTAQRFSEIHTPKIISSATEGGSEVFTVNYFEKRAFLSQSPQFYKQMTVGAGFERVFEIGHAYRAELHNTWRHLNEYVSLDVEMGFIKDETDLMDLEEGFLKFLFEQLNRNCKKELEMYNVELPVIIKIPRMTLSYAHEVLLDKFGKKSPVGNIDAEGEVLLSKYIKEKYDSDFVFLTAYPVTKRPMYTMPSDEDSSLTKSFDLIYKGLEITTGGQRIHDYEMLRDNISLFGMNPDDFGFYLESFRYGMPPHGGLAIGLERLTMKILDLENIRQSTLYPRDMNRIEP